MMSEEASPDRPHSFPFLGLWFLLVAGLIEVSVLTVQHFTIYPILRISREYVWMAPLALLLFAIPPLLSAWGLSRIWRHINWWWYANFSCVFFGYLNLLFLMPRLHHYAAVILAAGLSVQTLRGVEAKKEFFKGLVVKTIPIFIGSIFLLGLGIDGWQFLKEQQAYATVSPAEPESPNVLLITLDTVRAENLSVYGYHRKTTPNLERFAQSGIVFDQALSTASWTLPSHASIFTGQYPHNMSADWMIPLDDEHPTLAESFVQNGYVTGGFVANTGYCGYETGLDRGFIHYQDYRVTIGQMIANSTLARTIFDNFRLRQLVQNDEHLNRQSGDVLTADALSWLARKPDNPYFLFLNYYDAHEPYLPPFPYDKKFGPGRKHGKLSPLHRWNWDPAAGHSNMGEAEVREELDAYDGSLAYLDSHLGHLFQELKINGWLDNTLVIITADHGEEFGEHGVFDHGNSLYLPSVRVPLIMSFPGTIPEGKRIQEFVSLREIPVTIMDLLGWKPSVPFPGHSLQQYWTESKAKKGKGDPSRVLSEINYVKGHPEWFPVSKGDMKSVVANGFRIIQNGDGHIELYDIVRDPGETKNLASEKGMQKTLNDMQRHLEATLLSP